jgi:hypothetical protein
MPDDLLRESILNEEHLKLLSIAYMVSAAMTAFSSLFGLWFVFMGAIFRFATANNSKLTAKAAQAPPAWFGWVFGVIGLAIFVFLLALAALKLKAAFCIKQRKSRTFCMVVAAFTCAGVPYGTALGVFTFIVLGRDSVVRLFQTTADTPSLVSSV